MLILGETLVLKLLNRAEGSNKQVQIFSKKTVWIAGVLMRKPAGVDSVHVGQLMSNNLDSLSSLILFLVKIFV